MIVHETDKAGEGSSAAVVPENWTSWFTPGKFCLLLFLLIFALYPEIILGTHSFFDRDFGLFTYPVVKYAGQSLTRGEIPLWNPLNNSGIPFLAQWNTNVCYPLAWISFLLPLPWSLNYFCLGHLLVAGLGMYLLAFRWTSHRFAACIAGLVYALNGLTFNCLMWTSNLAALAWLPFVVLLVERAWLKGGRMIIAAACVATLQMLSGAPEIIMATWLILATWGLIEIVGRSIALKLFIARVGAIIALVCGLSAFQLLPFFELVHNSHRKIEAANGAWSMPPWGLANFLVPLFRCARTRLGPYIQVDQQWTSSYYLGIGAVALAVLALWKIKNRRVWWLGVLAVVGILIALGPNGFIYAATTKVFPGLAFARYPIKFIIPTVFAVPVLAAFATRWIDEPAPAARPELRRTLFTIAAILMLLIAIILMIARLFPHSDEVWSVTLENGLERVGFLAVVIFGLIFQSTASRLPQRRWLALGILVALGFDAITHTARQNPTVPIRAYSRLDLQMSPVPSLGVSRAMIHPRMQALMGRSSTTDPLVNEVGNRRSLFEDSNLIDAVPKVNGFFSLYLREQADIDSLLYNGTNLPAGLMDFLGVSQLSAAEEYWQWKPRPSALPLVTIGATPVFTNGIEILKAIANPGFDAKQTVFLEPETRDYVSVTSNSNAEVLSSKFKAQSVEIEVNATAPCLVVVAQTFYPGWKAFLDDHPTQILRANYAFQAIQVPVGRHHLRLVYQDRWFLVGLTVSALTLVLSGFGWFRFNTNSQTISDGRTRPDAAGAPV